MNDCSASDLTCDKRENGCCRVASEAAKVPLHWCAITNDRACACCISSDHPRGLNYVTASIAFKVADDSRKEYIQPFLRKTGPKSNRTSRPPSGPGTELKKLLHRLGFNSSQGCDCDYHASLMDLHGVEWCRDNIDMIVGWLQEAAKRRSLPFSRVVAVAIVKLAIRNASKNQRYGKRTIPPKAKGLRWQYGVTTVPSRFEDLLPRTLESLANGGFEVPRLFVDGADHLHLPTWMLRYEVTCRTPKIKAYGNWLLAAWELYIRDPQADRYAIFQDDLICCRNLREYIEKTDYPANGYLNLYSFPENERGGKKGWVPTRNQKGLGAVGLVFDNATMHKLLTQHHMIDRLHDKARRHVAIDGAVVWALNKIGIKEHVHLPGLLQHTGDRSSMKHSQFPLSQTFVGEDFDALELLK